MNQEKIGKFIQELRKGIGLTQNDLAEKLGVTNRAVSKWENGTSMPDISLFKPLCDELGISINELYNGEKNKEKVSDDNIINTINLANKKRTTDVIGYLIYKVLGIILIFISCMCWNVKGSFPTIAILVGAIFLIISSFRLTYNLKLVLRIIINTIYILIILNAVLLINHVYTIENETKPRIYFYHTKADNLESYNALFNTYCYCKLDNDNYMFNSYNNSNKEQKENTIIACKHVRNKK